MPDTYTKVCMHVYGTGLEILKANRKKMKNTENIKSKRGSFRPNQDLGSVLQKYGVIVYRWENKILKNIWIYHKLSVAMWSWLITCPLDLHLKFYEVSFEIL